MKKKIPLILLLLVILAGLAITTKQSIIHYHYLTNGGAITEASFCSISDTFNCDSVLTSAYSSVGPFSYANLGLLYYIFLLLPTLYALFVAEDEKAPLAIPLLSTLPALALSVYLAYVSHFILKNYCLLCMGLYITNILAFILLLKIQKTSPLKIFNWAKQFNFTKNLYGNGIYLLVVFGVGLLSIYQFESKYALNFDDFDQEAYLKFYQLRPVKNINTEGHPVWGNSQAKVKIVEFFDYECPACKMAALNLKNNLAPYKNRVQFVAIHYPLNKECNPLFTMEGGHPHACQAAYAAECAYKQGKFWDFHYQLFANQPVGHEKTGTHPFETEGLNSMAKSFNLDGNQFSSCLTSEETKKKVMESASLGASIPVQGTPTLLLNGKKLEAQDWYNPVMLKLLIEEEEKK